MTGIFGPHEGNKIPKGNPTCNLLPRSSAKLLATAEAHNTKRSYQFRRNVFVSLHPRSTHITGWGVVGCQGAQGTRDSCELVIFRDLLPS